jgi:hypothetical protein
MSDNIETTTKSKMPKAKKEKKAPKSDKYNGFKVPSKSGPITTKCVIHIYDMIKEAAPTLIERDDVRIAFNNFVDCLRKYDGVIESWIPSAKYKYNSGIKINENNKFEPLKGLACRFRYTYNDISESAKIILNAYRPLYDLIKRDIVPYMEIKHWEIRNKKDTEKYHKIIEKEERNIKTFEEAIQNARKVICEYAEKALALQTPPTVTKFD